MFRLVYITTPAKKEEKRDHGGEGADKFSLQFWKTGYLDVTKTKNKTNVPDITYLMCSLVLLLTISFKLSNC